MWKAGEGLLLKRVLRYKNSSSSRGCGHVYKRCKLRYVLHFRHAGSCELPVGALIYSPSVHIHTAAECVRLWTLGDSTAELASCPQGFQHAPNLHDALREPRFVGHVFRDALQGMDDGGVIPSPKRIADFDQL